MDETVKAAKLFLGMLDAGTFTQDKIIKKHLTKILKQWLLGDFSDMEVSEAERFFDSLTTEEKRIWQIIQGGRIVYFQDLTEGYFKSNGAIEKTLKNIRKKLDRNQFDFAISRARQEMKWTVRNGKKLSTKSNQIP
jgi:tRNA A37 N6-isopentenylltransferase MiaA